MKVAFFQQLGRRKLLDAHCNRVMQQYPLTFFVSNAK